MPDLWDTKRQEALRSSYPLAMRMRPRTLDQVRGQRHILGESKLLNRMLKAGRLTSLILHGPPGTGKTTLAEVIATHIDAHFVRENAASATVKQIRTIIDEATFRLTDSGRRTVLFLDEIHRFTKAQQDVLLADVERGTLTLIGATTENPLFTVNSALVSRSTVLQLEPLEENDLAQLLHDAISNEQRGFGKKSLTVDDEAIAHWARIADGDARRALNALEVAVLSASDESNMRITLDDAVESIQHKAVLYDRDGDQHYDHISAMIKSVRGSDPDAAVYWVARMLEGGEDPRFIARRLAILASEDIGNADPRAIMVADATWSLIERVGMPEARITLSQCAIYLALAPKSNASYVAINEAMSDVREGRTLPVPIALRDPNKAASAGSTKEGMGYQYSHTQGTQTPLGGITDESYLGVEKAYYAPKDVGFEKTLKERLAYIQSIRNAENK
ncbi:MAG: replication-associated recombination protein A [Phycisphaerales bacterium JB043]